MSRFLILFSEEDGRDHSFERGLIFLAAGILAAAGLVCFLLSQAETRSAEAEKEANEVISLEKGR